jgi:hypothetical protein
LNRIKTLEASKSDSHSHFKFLQPPPGLTILLVFLPRVLPGLLEFNASGIIP